jgi:hypothetical protein
MKELFKNKYLIFAGLASALGSSTASANLYVEHKRLEWGDARQRQLINPELYDTSRLGYQFDTGVYLEAGKDSAAFGLKSRLNNQGMDLNHEIFDDSNTTLTEVKVSFGKPYIQYERKNFKRVLYIGNVGACDTGIPSNCAGPSFYRTIDSISDNTILLGYKFDNDSYIELGDSSLEAGFRVGGKNLVIKGSFEVDIDLENLEINPEIQVRYTFAN